MRFSRSKLTLLCLHNNKGRATMIRRRWWIALLVGVCSSLAHAQDRSPEQRAREVEAQMTDDERFGLIHNLMVFVLDPTDFSQRRDPRVPNDVPQIAGWVRGVPRLG